MAFIRIKRWHSSSLSVRMTGFIVPNSFNFPIYLFSLFCWAYNLITFIWYFSFFFWTIVYRTTSWDSFHFSKLTFISSVQAFLLLIMPWAVKPHIGLLAVLTFSQLDTSSQKSSFSILSFSFQNKWIFQWFMLLPTL